MNRQTAESDPKKLATLLEDRPTRVDLRGTLLSAQCRVFSEEDPRDGFVARSLEQPFAAAELEPRPELVHWAFALEDSTGEKPKLLVPKSKEPYWRSVFPDWKYLDAVLHVLQPNTEIPELPSDLDVRHVDAQVDLSGLPDELRDELDLAVEVGHPIMASFVDDRPVAFCYAVVETEGWWDVSIETLEGHRRKGLAAAAFWELHRWMSAEKGKAPVWGAYVDNPASLKLAAKLGFREVGRMVSLKH